MHPIPTIITHSRLHLPPQLIIGQPPPLTTTTLPSTSIRTTLTLPIMPPTTSPLNLRPQQPHPFLLPSNNNLILPNRLQTLFIPYLLLHIPAYRLITLNTIAVLLELLVRSLKMRNGVLDLFGFCVQVFEREVLDCEGELGRGNGRG